MCFAFFFMAVEMLGGYFANSIAIFSDAAHLLSDVAAYLISIYVSKCLFVQKKKVINTFKVKRKMCWSRQKKSFC